MLVTCLSTSDTPHTFEHPKKSCTSSASGYFNAIDHAQSPGTRTALGPCHG